MACRRASAAVLAGGFLWCCSGVAVADVDNALATTEKWGVFELTLDGPDDDRAYVNNQISAVFDNSSDRRIVAGFYDGDGKYKIRFSPPSIGRWSYVTSSNVAQLAGVAGAFDACEPSADNHGPVRTHDKFFFEYADGATYFPVGTTAYQWTSVEQAIQQQTLQTLAAGPFNKLRMCVFPKWYHYGNRTEPWAHPFHAVDGRRDYAQPNYAFFKNLDLRVSQLRDMKIVADIILFHPYDNDNWGYSTMGREHDDRYLRYLVARLAPYRNVWWSLANEYDLMLHEGQKNASDFERLAKVLQNCDPYDRLRGIHNWYDSEDHFYDHSRDWITHASLQANDFRKTTLWRSRYRKPIVFDEMRYEGHVDANWGNLSAKAMTSYFWMAALSGGYGAHGETLDNQARGETRWWAKGGTITGDSLQRIAFFREIMHSAPLTRMRPVPELIDPKQSLEDQVYARCAPGEYCLAYVAKPDTEVKIDLVEKMSYRVDWIDTWNMQVTKTQDLLTRVLHVTTDSPSTVLRVVAVGGSEL